MAEKDVIFAGEAAEILGVNRQRVHQLAQKGRIGRQLAGRYWVFNRGELEAFKAAPKGKPGRPKNELKRPMENQTPWSEAA